ncbi:hypothetical protein F4694_003654 [Bacillus niacini]|uniref:Uncharacterized protein n=1 Tax=Neobacillus niacini TaxID=86668 RepID=A0A852TID1_9BACI|nr:hypothetical protein [Neobacillus niacini]
MIIKTKNRMSKIKRLENYSSERLILIIYRDYY